jgi:hypothetical protein
MSWVRLNGGIKQIRFVRKSIKDMEMNHVDGLCYNFMHILRRKYKVRFVYSTMVPCTSYANNPTATRKLVLWPEWSLNLGISKDNYWWTLTALVIFCRIADPEIFTKEFEGLSHMYTAKFIMLQPDICPPSPSHNALFNWTDDVGWHWVGTALKSGDTKWWLKCIHVRSASKFAHHTVWQTTES